MPMLYPETYLRVSFIPISAPSLVAGMSGESEKKIREIFDERKKMAPCLVFIDEIDVIMGKRESAQREMEKRIVAQMLTCMDDMALEKTDGKPVIIIAATNRPDSIDPALRRAGRFNKEINLGLMLPDEFDFLKLAKMTPGFVGADLNDVVSVAGTEAMKRMMTALKQRVVDTPLTPPTALTTDVMEIDSILTAASTSATTTTSTDLTAHPTPLSAPLRLLRSLVKHAGETPPDGDFSITYSDFLAAIPKVQPSARREGFATIPDTTWAHIGALHTVREQLTMAIIEPIRRPAAFARVGITAQLVSYSGDRQGASDKSSSARAPPSPASYSSTSWTLSSPSARTRCLKQAAKSSNTLLTELDGLSSRAGIYVVAATNRPDMIDPAMLRPGRLGTSVFIDLPNADERVEILRALYAKALPGAVMEGLEEVARDGRAEGYSGADLGNLHQAAAVAALRRDGGPSVKDAGKYRRLKERGM
ncbi:hypothetical protein VC83_09503 [Pseudogymnoascus destructans]|uniref:AAA+ ATPase domain-containing protein n=1 Tax=Pseudogymnoascus destructans TaxID=655981 RepID=A0A176ZWC6_9PEZI|nr:uncharacterized protein VC83_09503 [Pseudogymnoascus destructans]OAF54208.1 hypothetical protein VC83_09503 [Pseudogymnoascus destructans]